MTTAFFSPIAKRDSANLCRLSAAAAAAAFRVPFAALFAVNRCRRPIARARQAAIYLAHVGFGLSYLQAGQGFARDRTTVSHACALIEDAREQRRLDLSLTWLEAALRHYAGYCASFDSPHQP